MNRRSNSEEMRRAVFLDRDGTLNEEVGYLDAIDKLAIIPQAYEAVRRINALGVLAIVITNQSGIARGLFDEAFVRKLHRHMSRLFRDHGAVIDAFYYCPHHPTEGLDRYRRDCRCRKPAPGLLLRAARQWRIDLASSYMVGDDEKDIALIKQVGGKGVLVGERYGADTYFPCAPDYRAHHILEAVTWIEGDFGHEHPHR